ncbi:MAG: polysaccharide deacetylase family protein, partial [Nocardioides sp.]
MSEPEGSSVVGVEPSSRSVVLTYDDGPTPGVTDQLLAVLAEADATATFFVLLTRVRPHLALLRELLAAGHEIGLHGPDHRRLTTLPPEARSALP